MPLLPVALLSPWSHASEAVVKSRQVAATSASMRILLRPVMADEALLVARGLRYSSLTPCVRWRVLSRCGNGVDGDGTAGKGQR
jgi:hypothetical protein